MNARITYLGALLAAVALLVLTACLSNDASKNPTVQSAGHQAAGAGTAAGAASPVKIAGVQLNPTPSLNLKNEGSAPIDLSGWKLKVGNATAALPGNLRLEPNQTVTLHMTPGQSSGNDIYVGQDAAALVLAMQPGASVALLNSQGQVVSETALPKT